MKKKLQGNYLQMQLGGRSNKNKDASARLHPSRELQRLMKWTKQVKKRNHKTQRIKYSLITDLKKIEYFRLQSKSYEKKKEKEKFLFSSSPKLIPTDKISACLRAERHQLPKKYTVIVFPPKKHDKNFSNWQWRITPWVEAQNPG